MCSIAPCSVLDLVFSLARRPAPDTSAERHRRLFLTWSIATTPRAILLLMAQLLSARSTRSSACALDVPARLSSS